MQVGYNSLGSITSTDVLYLHTDHLDTPRLATNASQTVVWKLPPHEPFGTAQAQQDPDQDGIATDIPLRFAGQVFDADTGLHYNYFRDYDPWTGRYIQSDPIGLEGGLNTYGYVGGNPLRFVDPFGLAQEDVDRAIKIISSCEPLIWNPNVSVKLGDLPSSLFGVTDRKTRNITLSKSSFGGQLNESEKYHLLSTLAHEYMHSKQSTISWYALGLDDFLGEPIGMHKKIIRNSMDLRQETYDAWNDGKTSCECD